MKLRTLKVAAVFSVALNILYVAWLTESLVAAESTWYPIDIVIVGVRMPFFPPWGSYLGVGLVFWLAYWWQGRR